MSFGRNSDVSSESTSDILVYSIIDSSTIGEYDYFYVRRELDPSDGPLSRHRNVLIDLSQRRYHGACFLLSG